MSTPCAARSSLSESQALSRGTLSGWSPGLEAEPSAWVRSSANALTWLLKRLSCSTTPSRLARWLVAAAPCWAREAARKFQTQKSVKRGFKMFHFLPRADPKTQRRRARVDADLRSEQIHSERIQDVSDVAGHRREHGGAPSCSVDLIEDRETRKHRQQEEVLNSKRSGLNIGTPDICGTQRNPP